MSLSAAGRVIRELAEAAAHANQLAGNPLGVVGGEEGSDAGDVVTLADTAERSLRDSPLLEVRTDETCRVRAFGLNHAGVDGVHADLPGAKFLGEDAGDGIDRALSPGIDRAAWRCQATDDRADIDDACALAEVGNSCLRGE